MSPGRQARAEEIGDLIGRRKLVWFGVRGVDAVPLLEFEQFRETFSLIAPLRSVSAPIDRCLESYTRRRVDLDAYSLDEDAGPPARRLRLELYESLAEPAVVVSYRPLRHISAAVFPRAHFVRHLGLFHECQAPFEHKAWVETCLREAGVPTIPWDYYSLDDLGRLRERLASGVHVMRAVRSDGGAGVFLVDHPDQIPASACEREEGFVAVSPLLEPSIPLNVNAVVFEDGSVTIHGVSRQIIGDPQLSTRRFGYCGNDFDAARHLSRSHLEQLHSMISLTAKWLSRRGYLGAFGVDALAVGDEVLLTEVNPRFQGSTATTAEIDRRLDRPDPLMEHMGAFYGLSPAAGGSVPEIASAQPPARQIVMHNTTGRSIVVRGGPPQVPAGGRIAGWPDEDVVIEPEATIARVVWDGVASDAVQIDRAVAAVITGIRSRMVTQDRTEEVN